jgi:methyltransferase FkbM-like protein
MQLDTFCEGSGPIPNVLKIDVEGAEGKILGDHGELGVRRGIVIRMEFPQYPSRSFWRLIRS